MLQSAKCPNCGADIQVNPNDKTAVCSFCRSNIIIKEAINLHNGAVETVTGEAEKERVLKMADDCLKKGLLDKAARKYFEITEKYPNDYRGWWGIIQCSPISDDVKVSFVESFDGTVHMIDSCHGNLILDRMDEEFEAAIALAPEDIKEKIVEIQKHRNAQLDKSLVLNQIEIEKTKIQDVEEIITTQNNNIKKLEEEIEKERVAINSSNKTIVIELLIVFAIGLFIVPHFHIIFQVLAYLFMAIVLLCLICGELSYIKNREKNIEQLNKQREYHKIKVNNCEATISSHISTIDNYTNKLSELQAELEKLRS